MQLVAIGAGERVALVRAGVPAGARIVLMAVEAGLVALAHREERAGLEAVDRALLVAALGRVLGAGAVAGLALQPAGAERRVLVAAVRVLGLEDRRGVKVAVSASSSWQPRQVSAPFSLYSVPGTGRFGGCDAAAEAGWSPTQPAPQLAQMQRARQRGADAAGDATVCADTAECTSRTEQQTQRRGDRSIACSCSR